MKVINRVFKYLEINNIKHTRFEKEIGLSNGYLNTQLKRNASLGEDVINKIIDNCLDINPLWLLTGQGKMLINDSVNNELTSSGNKIPFFELRAEAGVPSIFNDDRNFTQASDYYLLPNFQGDDVFITDVWGDSMNPNYCSGDKVVCKYIREVNFIQWSRVYLLDTTQGLIIKRIEPTDNDDIILCESFNSKYKPFQIPKSEIRSMSIVLGLLRKEG